MEWVIGVSAVMVVALIVFALWTTSHNPPPERRTSFKAPHPKRRSTDFIHDYGPGDAEDATEQEKPPRA